MTPTHPTQTAGVRLSDLLAKLESAAGPSEELDAFVRCALFAPVGAYVEQSKFNGAWCVYHGEYNGRSKVYDGPHGFPRGLWLSPYTKSIDAAVGLVEMKRPGWHWEVARDNTAMVRDPSCDAFARADHVCWGNEAKTPALALLIALLRSVLSKTEGEG